MKEIKWGKTFWSGNKIIIIIWRKLYVVLIKNVPVENSEVLEKLFLDFLINTLVKEFRVFTIS